jgi:YVTN family beta-propeller protein
MKQHSVGNDELDVSSSYFAAARQPRQAAVAIRSHCRLAHVGAKLLHGVLVRLVAIALVVVSAGCGTAQEPKSTDQSTKTPDETQSVVAAEITLPAKELFGPVAGEGALWLRDVDTGSIFRVDPEKNELTATIDVGPGCCLAVGEGAVWAAGTEAEQLLRIDPASNKVTAQIRVGELPEGPAVAFGSVWVSNHRGGTVSRVDPKTNKVVASVKVSPPGPAGPGSIGRGGDAMWVGVSQLGKVVRINPLTNKVSGALKIPGAGCHDSATSGAMLWLAGGCLDAVEPTKIWKIDTRRMKVAATIEPGGDVGAPTLWRNQLWMLTGQHLVSIDKKTNRVTERAAIEGPGGAAVADGTLWVSNASKLLRLHLA